MSRFTAPATSAAAAELSPGRTATSRVDRQPARVERRAVHEIASSISSAKAGNPPGCRRTHCAATPQAAPVTGSPLPSRRPTLGGRCPPAAEPPLGPAEPAPHASRAQPSSPSRPPSRPRLPVARLPQGKPDCRQPAPCRYRIYPRVYRPTPHAVGIPKLVTPWI